ncbi:MAG: hypothetical protein WCY41_01835 [Candidatus Micrarchaeia archaeon]
MRMKKMAKTPVTAIYDTPALREFLKISCAVEDINRSKQRINGKLAQMERMQAELAAKPGARSQKAAKYVEATAKSIRIRLPYVYMLQTKYETELKNAACALTQEVRGTVGTSRISKLHLICLNSVAHARTLQKHLLALSCVLVVWALTIGTGVFAAGLAIFAGFGANVAERGFRKDAMCLEKIMDAEKIAIGSKTD